MLRFLVISSLFWGMSCLGLPIEVQAQDDYVDAKTASEKTKKAYREAYNYQTQRDYPAAERAYQKLIKRTPNFVNAYLQLGGVYQSQGHLDAAYAEYQKAAELAPDYDPNVYLAMGNVKMLQEQYREAVPHLQKFLTYSNIVTQLRQKAQKRLDDALFRADALEHPVPFAPQSLGPNINTFNREYFPSVTLDDALVYTVQTHTGNHYQEDLYMSRLVDGIWQPGLPLPVNTKENNEGAQSISADGTALVFTVCNRPGDKGSCDLYYSVFSNGRWTPPLNVGAPINTNQWESQPSLSADGKTLYFVRGIPRGQGTRDLYRSQLQPNGTWTEPEPIESLNTPFNEGAPTLHPDGRTLYFSSDGHPGMGGGDLFVSRLQADGTWGKPQNLGYPINTAEHEEALAVSRKGNLAYIASNREGGAGSMDIYQFELPEAVRPSPVTYVKGLVVHALTDKPLAAAVELVDLATQQTVAQLNTPNDGQFILCLPVGRYALRVNKEGFLFYSATYDLVGSTSLDEPYTLKAPLQPVQDDKEAPIKRTPIVLENVFFATASAELRPESKAELDALKKLLETYPKVRILLSGHTDNVGSTADNQVLSEARATAVRQYLIDAGIAADRLEAKGFGETQPRYSNDSDLGRAGNRRTTFELIP